MSLLQKYIGMIARAPENEGGGGDNNQQQQQQQQQQTPWYENASYGFDEPTKRFYAGKNYPDEKTALNSLRHADELARSRNVIEKPDPAKAKDWSGYSELGWSPQKDKYVVNKPTLQDGEKLDEASFNAFVEVAHANKVPAWQAEAIYSAMDALDRQSARDAAAAGADEKRKAEQQLRKDWGADFDSKMAGARRAFAFLGEDGFTADEIAAALGSPRVAKMLAKMFTLIGEDNMPAPGQGHSGGTSPGAARAERLQLEADPKWMAVFTNPRDPKHADYVAKRQSLLEIEQKGSARAA